MGGLKQNSDDYRYVWARFLDPADKAYALDNYSVDDIWKDPNKDFSKNKSYDKKQFSFSITRMVEKMLKLGLGAQGMFASL
jgi:hypothetical protein